MYYVRSRCRIHSRGPFSTLSRGHSFLLLRVKGETPTDPGLDLFSLARLFFSFIFFPFLLSFFLFFLYDQASRARNDTESSPECGELTFADFRIGIGSIRLDSYNKPINTPVAYRGRGMARIIGAVTCYLVTSGISSPRDYISFSLSLFFLRHRVTRIRLAAMSDDDGKRATF